MYSLHLFNPGHETAILHGSENYTPSINVQRMTRELSVLPMWYAASNDYVYTEELNFTSIVTERFGGVAHPVSESFLLKEKETFQALAIKPWGLSPHSCGFFKHLIRKGVPLVSPEWKEEYKRLTDRRTAAQCFRRLKQMLPGHEFPETPFFCTNIEEAYAYISRHCQKEFVIKSPFSSSGRGVMWIERDNIGRKDEQWMSGVLKKQTLFSIEPALDKVQDFAMEFYSDGNGHIKFEGFSVFSTVSQGAYSGNLLGSQKFLFQQLVGYQVVENITLIKDKIKDVLSEIYAFTYEGYLGVDMMLYKSSKEEEILIHPCVEINMRYTMGLVALQLSRKLLSECSTGHFSIAFNSSPGKTYDMHCQMQKRFPLIIENDKIISGYMPLCPVGPQNGYMAYVLIQSFN